MIFSKHGLAAADSGVGQRESVLLGIGEPHSPGKLIMEGRGKNTGLGVSETQRRHYEASEAENGVQNRMPRGETASAIKTR